jgi:hypothetical protein
VKLSEDRDVEVNVLHMVDGPWLAPYTWQQQLRDAICTSFAGKAAQQAGGLGKETYKLLQSYCNSLAPSSAALLVLCLVLCMEHLLPLVLS